MLGFMQSSSYGIDGVDGSQKNFDSTGEPVAVNDQARYSGDLGIDPRHDFSDVIEQLFGTYPAPAGQQPTGNFQAINPRQVDIQDEHLRVGSLNQIKAVQAIVRLRHDLKSGF